MCCGEEKSENRPNKMILYGDDVMCVFVFWKRMEKRKQWGNDVEVCVYVWWDVWRRLGVLLLWVYMGGVCFC